MMNGFDFGTRTYIMGILNLTPDSFSGDGIYKDADLAVERAVRMVEEGADIIDVGGESTRPGAPGVSPEEEISRVIPVIKKLVKKINKPVSIDTRKSEVAYQALDAGTSIINDISGLEFDQNMAELAGRYNAGVVIMHMKGIPCNMQEKPFYDDVITEIIDKLVSLVRNAEDRGVKKENIIVDPGIGFGKTCSHNLEILGNLSRFKILGKPVLVGTSRKSFIGNILGIEPSERIFGTAASVAIAIQNGADIVRVHDIRQIKEAARVADAIVRTGEKINV
jgi:dihydropteroate synthase